MLDQQTLMLLTIKGPVTHDRTKVTHDIFGSTYRATPHSMI